MIRKILVVVVVLGFAWSYPPMRQRMMLAMSPAFELLGPVGDRMAQPARRWKAESDITFIMQQFQLEKTEGRKSPATQRDFEVWMLRKQSAGDKGKDPWGQLYWLKRANNTVTVGSHGPDHEPNTADDITQTIVL